MREVAKNIFSEDRFGLPTGLPGGYRGCNPSYVTTSEGIVVIDTPQLPTDSVNLRDELAAKGQVRYIINSHYHVDHVAGNSFLPGTVISSEGVRQMFFAPLAQVTSLRTEAELAEMERTGNALAEHIRRIVQLDDPEGLHFMDGYRLKPPAITFNDRPTLHVGEYTFELINLPGHTVQHIGVYIPEAKVFFTGDNFTSQTQPSLAQSSPREWVRSLKKIEAMDIKMIVPGHGKICGPQEVGPFREFIQKCIDIVDSAIKKGLSKEEIVATVSFETLDPGAGKVTAVHPGSDMQRKNVLRLYEMLTK